MGFRKGSSHTFKHTHDHAQTRVTILANQHTIVLGEISVTVHWYTQLRINNRPKCREKLHIAFNLDHIM